MFFFPSWTLTKGPPSFTRTINTTHVTTTSTKGTTSHTIIYIARLSLVETARSRQPIRERCPAMEWFGGLRVAVFLSFSLSLSLLELTPTTQQNQRFDLA